MSESLKKPRLSEVRAAMIREQTETKRTAREALRRVMEREDATTAEILEAARLLVEMGGKENG